MCAITSLCATFLSTTKEVHYFCKQAVVLAQGAEGVIEVDNTKYLPYVMDPLPKSQPQARTINIYLHSANAMDLASKNEISLDEDNQSVLGNDVLSPLASSANRD